MPNNGLPDDLVDAVPFASGMQPATPTAAPNSDGLPGDLIDAVPFSSGRSPGNAAPTPPDESGWLGHKLETDLTRGVTGLVGLPGTLLDMGQRAAFEGGKYIAKKAGVPEAAIGNYDDATKDGVASHGLPTGEDLDQGASAIKNFFTTKIADKPYTPYESTTTAGRVGDAAIQSLVGGAAARGTEALTQAAPYVRNATQDIISGLTGQGASELVPDWAKPYAGLVGGLAGAKGTQLAEKGIVGVGNAANDARTQLTDPEGAAQARASAAVRTMSDNPQGLDDSVAFHAANPNAIANPIGEQGPTRNAIAPLSYPQATNDQGLLALENTVRGASPQGIRANKNLQAAQNGAVTDALGQVLPPENISQGLDSSNKAVANTLADLGPGQHPSVVGSGIAGDLGNSLQQAQAVNDQMLSQLNPSPVSDTEAGNAAEQAITTARNNLVTQRATNAKQNYAATDASVGQVPNIDPVNQRAALQDIIDKNSGEGAFPAQLKIAAQAQSVLDQLLPSPPKPVTAPDGSAFLGPDGKPFMRMQPPPRQTLNTLHNNLMERAQAAAGNGQIFSDLDTASQRRLARIMAGATEADLNAAADKAEQSGSGDQSAQSLIDARNSYRQDSQPINDLAATPMGRHFDTDNQIVPEQTAARLKRMAPSELQQFLDTADQHTPEAANQVRRYLMQDPANLPSAEHQAVITGGDADLAQKLQDSAAAVANHPAQDIQGMNASEVPGQFIRKGFSGSAEDFQQLRDTIGPSSAEAHARDFFGHQVDQITSNGQVDAQKLAKLRAQYADVLEQVPNTKARLQNVQNAQNLADQARRASDLADSLRKLDITTNDADGNRIISRDKVRKFARDNEDEIRAAGGDKAVNSLQDVVNTMDQIAKTGESRFDGSTGTAQQTSILKNLENPQAKGIKGYAASAASMLGSVLGHVMGPVGSTLGSGVGAKVGESVAERLQNQNSLVKEYLARGLADPEYLKTLLMRPTAPKYQARLNMSNALLPDGLLPMAKQANDEQRKVEPRASGGAVSQTTAEPKSDIHAQIKAVARRSNPKDAMFVAKGNEDAIPKDLPPGVRHVQRAEGTLITRNYRKAQIFANTPHLTDDHMASLLGYPETKAQAMASGKPVVVEARNKKGNVITQALASPQKAGLAAAAFKGHGSGIHVTNAIDAQKRRGQ